MAINMNRSSSPQGQLDELERQIAGFNGSVPAQQMAGVQDLYNRRNALRQQIAGQQPAPIDPVQASRDRSLQLLQGRGDELRKDPVHGSVMDYLKGVLSGKDAPYNDTTMNALRAQQGKGFADREAAQMQQLRDSLQATGGSIYDPSYQAASREAESRRMGANLDYAGQLDSKANLANFDARNQASRQLDASNASQNQQITNAGLNEVGFRERDRVQTPEAANPAQTIGPILMPQYMPQQQQPAAQAAPAQPKPAAAQPKPAAAPAPGFQGGSGVPYPYVAPAPQPANQNPSYVQLAGQPASRQYIGGVPSGQQIVDDAIWKPRF